MADYIKGIDISGYQVPPHASAPIDWDKVYAAGVRFAIIKCSQGNYYHFKGYAQAKADAKARGIAVGAYHFADLSLTPEVNAKKFADCMGPLENGDLFPSLDVEGGKGGIPAGMNNDTITQWLLDFATAFKAYCPYPLILYSSSQHLTSPDVLKGFPYIWSARWSDNPPTGPSGFRYYPTWTIWQYRGDNGKVDGVYTACDQDYVRPEDLPKIQVGGGAALASGKGGSGLGLLVAAGLGLLALKKG